MISTASTFVQRTFSTVILLSLLVAAVVLDSHWGYAGLIAILCNLTSYEWFRMQKDKLSMANRGYCLLMGLIYPWMMAGATASLVDSVGLLQQTLVTGSLMIAGLVLFCIIGFFKELFSMDYGSRTGSAAISQLGLMLLSFVYPVWLFCFSFFFLLSNEATDLLLWIIIVTKLSDIFAYLSGMMMGRKLIKRPFSPTVSPKKSWEGIIGSFILTSIASCLLFNLIVKDIDTSIGTILVITAILFVLSVTGDLAGSLIKRGIEIKDSGSLLPGIGGIFDLIDSPAFTISCTVALALPLQYIFT